jgi:hypothetical protein
MTALTRIATGGCLGILILAIAATGDAIVVGGGGAAPTDCLAVFDAPVNTPASRPRDIRCADGDPCDADGEVNGSCQFPVSMCANSDYNSARCSLVGVNQITVEHALDNGDPRFDPQFQALQNRIDNQILEDPPTTDINVCTTPTNFTVQVQGPFGATNTCRKGQKYIRVTTVSSPISGKVYRDADRMRLTCDPAPVGCDPMVLFDGTYDRIQRQIFNQRCAISACHDSQSQQAGMVLETGASYTNLLNVTPSNPAAQAEGWKRVTTSAPDLGDPVTSFIHRKITGDFPGPFFGGRMPLGEPKLDQALIDVIRCWIEQGAPPACNVSDPPEVCWQNCP